MPAYYTYLIASLPMLHFGMKPPFSSEKFPELCRELIPEDDFFLLKNIPHAQEYASCPAKRPVIAKWVAFDTALRNELVKTRASRRHLEPEKYLRPGQKIDLSLTPLALNAQRHPQILEAERILDDARWKELDGLSFGHYFDLDALIIYAYKLRILERWEKIRTADKQVLLKDTLKG